MQNQAVVKLLMSIYKNSLPKLPVYLANPIFNRACGAMFGSFLGDALGSYCQFRYHIEPNVIEKCMTMPGGGTFDIEPGQLTDDSELALAMSEGILQAYNNQKSLQQQQSALIRNVGVKYVKWLYKDQPFDVGNTCRGGIQAINKYLSVDNWNQTVVSKVQEGVRQVNEKSLSNGYLMRIEPMAVFCAFLQQSKEQKQILIKNEIGLTHSNKIAQEAGYQWVTLLQKLINRQSDAEIMDIYKQFRQRCYSHKDLQEWMAQGEKQQRMKGTTNMGNSKIAWTYGVHYLHKIVNGKLQINSALYQKVMQEVILEAGDTDTNACIVGGLIGSIVGISNLPQDYLQKSLGLEFNEKSPTFRNNCYMPRRGIEYVYTIYEKTLKNK